MACLSEVVVVVEGMERGYQIHCFPGLRLLFPRLQWEKVSFHLANPLERGTFFSSWAVMKSTNMIG